VEAVLVVLAGRVGGVEKAMAVAVAVVLVAQAVVAGAAGTVAAAVLGVSAVLGGEKEGPRHQKK
jgi:hypothetical protein